MNAEADVEPVEIPPCPPDDKNCESCPWAEWCLEHIDSPEA